MLNINNINDRYELFVEGDTNDADYINHNITNNICKIPEEFYIETSRVLYELTKYDNHKNYSIREQFLSDDETVDMEVVEKYAPKLKELEETIIQNYYGCCDDSLEMCLYDTYQDYIPYDSEYCEPVHTITKVELYKIKDKIAYQYDFEANEWKKKIQFFD